MEMRVVAHRIARGLSAAGHACTAGGREQSSSGTLLLLRDGEPAIKLRQSDRDPWILELESATSRRQVPFPGPVASPGLRDPRLLLFTCCEESSRRTRMIVRTIAELRRRGVQLKVAALGPLAHEVRQGDSVDFWFGRLGEDELENLLARTSVFLECADERGLRTPAGALAASSGIPVVVHASAFDDQGSSGRLTVDEWSADAFSEAVLTAQTASGMGERSEALLRDVIRELALD